MPPTPAPKSIFKSKTAFAQFLMAAAGALGTFIPDFGRVLSEHANTILLVAGAVGVVLRMATKGRVVLFAE